ncbi:MAG: DUF2071 domain-containing protein [Verrucomicrobia bacterium]|nr:DUF2071 domain-containing protein [Verrucomicrobiota bacterium]
MNAEPRSIFLTAEWRMLAMLNFEIAPALLAPFVPAGTELDSWNGKTFVSLVGFRFLKTCVLGVPIPFHRNFDEVNLRFYVRRKADEGWRRGVVFIKEIVPRAAIAFVARNFYNEPYIALPMTHRLDSGSAKYSWRFNGRSNSMKVVTRGAARPLREGSEAEFITEHFWGYTAQRDGATLEYRVEHPRWRVWEDCEAKLDCDVAGLYGWQFVAAMSAKPASAFLAEGSAVSVSKGARLKP